ncbi:MAG TPA: YqaA family protein [Stenotrophomonas sp.]|jgi:membrane protein YqaA with SNARE-associated domain
MTQLGVFLGIFVVALLAATILPMQSEAALVGLLLGGYPAVWLVAVASAGNVLGSLVNWWLGRELLRFQGRRWFPLGAEKLAQVQHWYRRYGKWSLLLSWVPIIGDPLTLAAGTMREPLRFFLPLVAIAKVARYGVLAWATLRWI